MTRKLHKVDFFETLGEARNEKARRDVMTTTGAFIIKKRKANKKYPYGRFDLYKQKAIWES